MIRPTEKFLEFNGTRLQYLDWGGTGTPMLFLPGMGCSAHIFDTFAPMFASSHHVIGLSRRGHGRSTPVTGELELTTLAGDIAALINHLDLQTVCIVAHSFGCAEASWYCARNPDRVESVMLLDGGYDYRKFCEIDEDDPLTKVEHPALHNVSSKSEFFNRMRRMRPDLDFIWHEFSDAYLRDFVHFTGEGFVEERVTPETYGALQNILFTYEPEWHTHQVPLMSVFAMWNVHEYAMPDYLDLSQREKVSHFIDTVKVPAQREWIKQFQDKVPRAKVSVIEKGHHYCFLSHKKTTAQLIESFLTAAN